MRLWEQGVPIVDAHPFDAAIREVRARIRRDLARQLCPDPGVWVAIVRGPLRDQHGNPFHEQRLEIAMPYGLNAAQP